MRMLVLFMYAPKMHQIFHFLRIDRYVTNATFSPYLLVGEDVCEEEEA